MRGQTVGGRYRLESVLGRGGMATVWLAEDQLLGRWVALKRGNGETLNEARAAARLSHPGVVRVLDLVADGDRPWIVLEALSGRTLADAIRELGPLPVDRVRRIGLCLLDVLEAVHAAGLVHRDVKPGNVQLCADGRVVLFDFGIALFPGHTAEAPDGFFQGSPAFVSPEQLHGAALEPSTDLFSLGATLYAAVEGRSPFDRGDLFATVLAVSEATPAPFRHAGPLQPVIEGLLRVDPGERWTVTRTREALQAQSLYSGRGRRARA
ncbi:serine/threonine-protein kinase [Paractinoplanes brasiliensis]|uniref:non-specific serine/threonine protein kinase n=1 Tax=Paractinoplanes brasiliensis TaxID=52695 RepID=A0A4R6JN18_9ACTN|nr:serine/threonine-protein kinase [Actinoplanes brasiliensis]TDO37277.1 protein kinase-like protein [Actinoplanes brasiliensis]GID29409.1 hypothetical protein Abr02nite_43920 [Actinoplanes brasiliensis]